MNRATLAIAAAFGFAGAAAAQTASPPPVVTAPVVAAIPAQPKAERCLRLPLSDVAFGKEAATNAARAKLDEYAAQEMHKRKWPSRPVAKSRETVSCEVYLNFGPVGTEYRCLVTTTYCLK